MTDYEAIHYFREGYRHAAIAKIWFPPDNFSVPYNKGKREYEIRRENYTANHISDEEILKRIKS